MKVAIRSKDGITVSDSVTCFSGYLIYELDGEKIVKREFRKCDSSHSTDLRYIGDCDAIISRTLMPEERESLRKKGKEVLITFNSSPEEALRIFLNQRIFSDSFVQ